MRTRVLSIVLVTALAGCGDGGPFQSEVATTNTTISAADTTEAVDLEVAGIDFSTLDLPPGDPYDDYRELVDDSGTIRVEVPDDWSDIDPRPS